MWRRRRRLSCLEIELLSFLLVSVTVHQNQFVSFGFISSRIGCFRTWGDKINNHVSFAESNGDDLIPPPRRVQQVRRKSINRKPRNYWADLGNLRYEFRKFWTDLGVHLSSTEPPPIPNESLLNHLERGDLRYAIVLFGGREALSRELGGSRILSGTWTTAVQTSPELQQLIQEGKLGLDSAVPPLSPGQKKKLKTTSSVIPSTKVRQQTRWSHSDYRKPHGYWSLQRTVQDLYDHLENNHGHRPAVWMPRPAELGACGRTDLQLAVGRFGGAKRIARVAGLVPHHEWHYFEGQYQLLCDLRNYIDEHCEGNRAVFPCASAIQRQGYDTLYSLIQQYGGRKWVANRLSMQYGTSSKASDEFSAMNWGPFSIDFAIQLLEFILADQMRRRAPLQRPVIAMPSKAKLLRNGESRLHELIIEDMGGYENVARRLGLAYFV